MDTVRLTLRTIRDPMIAMHDRRAIKNMSDKPRRLSGKAVNAARLAAPHTITVLLSMQFLLTTITIFSKDRLTNDHKIEYKP